MVTAKLVPAVAVVGAFTAKEATAGLTVILALVPASVPDAAVRVTVSRGVEGHHDGGRAIEQIDRGGGEVDASACRCW